MPISRRALAAAAAVAVVLPLSACGSGGDDSGSTDASGKVEGSITFQTWNLRANFKPYFDGLVEDFEKKYPGTHVKWIDQPGEGYADKISADAAGGTLPDVVNVSPDLVAPLAKAGLALDLDKAAPKYKKEYLAGRLGEPPDTGHGRHVRLPLVPQHRPLFYNKGLFKKAGLDAVQAADDVRRALRRRAPAREEEQGQGGHARQRPHHRGLRPLRRPADEQGGHRLRVQRRQGCRTPARSTRSCTTRRRSTRRR